MHADRRTAVDVARTGIGADRARAGVGDGDVAAVGLTVDARGQVVAGNIDAAGIHDQGVVTRVGQDAGRDPIGVDRNAAFVVNRHIAVRRLGVDADRVVGAAAGGDAAAIADESVAGVLGIGRNAGGAVVGGGGDVARIDDGRIAILRRGGSTSGAAVSGVGRGSDVAAVLDGRIDANAVLGVGVHADRAAVIRGGSDDAVAVRDHDGVAVLAVSVHALGEAVGVGGDRAGVDHIGGAVVGRGVDTNRRAIGTGRRDGTVAAVGDDGVAVAVSRDTHRAGPVITSAVVGRGDRTDVADIGITVDRLRADADRVRTLVGIRASLDRRGDVARVVNVRVAEDRDGLDRGRILIAGRVTSDRRRNAAAVVDVGIAVDRGSIHAVGIRVTDVVVAGGGGRDGASVVDRSTVIALGEHAYRVVLGGGVDAAVLARGDRNRTGVRDCDHAARVVLAIGADAAVDADRRAVIAQGHDADRVISIGLDRQGAGDADRRGVVTNGIDAGRGAEHAIHVHRAAVVDVDIAGIGIGRDAVGIAAGIHVDRAVVGDVDAAGAKRSGVDALRVAARRDVDDVGGAEHDVDVAGAVQDGRRLAAAFGVILGDGAHAGCVAAFGVRQGRHRTGTVAIRRDVDGAVAIDVNTAAAVGRNAGGVGAGAVGDHVDAAGVGDVNAVSAVRNDADRTVVTERRDRTGIIDRGVVADRDCADRVLVGGNGTDVAGVIDARIIGADRIDANRSVRGLDFDIAGVRDIDAVVGRDGDDADRIPALRGGFDIAVVVDARVFALGDDADRVAAEGTDGDVAIVGDARVLAEAGRVGNDAGRVAIVGADENLAARGVGDIGVLAGGVDASGIVRGARIGARDDDAAVVDVGAVVRVHGDSGDIRGDRVGLDDAVVVDGTVAVVGIDLNRAGIVDADHAVVGDGNVAIPAGIGANVAGSGGDDDAVVEDERQVDDAREFVARIHGVREDADAGGFGGAGRQAGAGEGNATSGEGQHGGRGRQSESDGAGSGCDLDGLGLASLGQTALRGVSVH